MHGNRRFFAGLAIVLGVLAVLPVAAIVGRGLAFGAGDTWTHLAATVLPRYVANTVALVVLVGAGVAIGGTAAGWLVACRSFPGSRFFAWALLLPLAMPSYVMAYAYTDFLQYAGPVQTALRETFGWSHGDYWFPEVRSLPGAAAMFVFTLYPYVFLLARTAFFERPPALIEAARTLGLDRRAAFWRVELPLARPAIAGGIALALMETLADFGTVAYFAVDTFTTGVYRAWFSLGDRTAAAQLATVLLVFVIGAVALERASRGAARTYGGARGRQTSRYAAVRLTGMRAAAATTLCVIPLLAGFVLPVLLLLRLLSFETDVALTSRFFAWGLNSLRVAVLAAVLAVVLATVVAYAIRLAPGVDHARRQSRADPGLCSAGHGACGRRAAAARRAGQLARDGCARRYRPLSGIAAHRNDFRARLRVPRPLLRRGMERHRAGVRAHHAGDGRRGAQPRRRRVGHVAARARAVAGAKRRGRVCCSSSWT